MLAAVALVPTSLPGATSVPDLSALPGPTVVATSVPSPEGARGSGLHGRPSTGSATFTRRARGASYRLLDSHSRWDPCRVITYRVNPRLAPIGGVTDVRRAFRFVSAASGLRFRYLGRTAHVPRRGGDTTFDPTADVSVAWARPTVVPVLAGSTVGYAGTQWRSTGGSWNEITHGYVVLDATWKGVPGFPLRKVQSRGQLLLHETGHVVGLDHVNDRTQTLHPTLQRAPARFGTGDLAGLAAVGAGQGCL